MIRKTALLTGFATAFLIAAPAFAQDATTQQTPEPATAEASATSDWGQVAPEAAPQAETDAAPVAPEPVAPEPVAPEAAPETAPEASAEPAVEATAEPAEEAEDAEPAAAPN